jgi:hypothetical protein
VPDRGELKKHVERSRMGSSKTIIAGQRPALGKFYDSYNTRQTLLLESLLRTLAFVRKC